MAPERSVRSQPGYRFEDSEHFHYPDYQGRWLDGTPFVADAGSSESLQSGRDLAAASASRLTMQIAGGRYFIGTEATIAPTLHWNLINLHARRRHHELERFAELAAEIQPLSLRSQAVSIRGIVEALAGDRWTAGEVQAAGWKVAADAAAAGRLLVIGGLRGVQLDHDTTMELQATELPPVIPDPLPETLDIAPTALPPRPAPPSAGRPSVPGPTIDDSQLEMLRAFRALSAAGKAATFPRGLLPF